MDNSSTIAGMSRVSKLHNGSRPKGKNSSRDAADRFLRTGPFVNIVSILSALGCDPEPVFRQTGFALDQFNDPDRRLPYLQASRLLAACVEETGCEHFGLLLGESASASHLGVAGFLMRSAPSVEKALGSLNEHFDLHDGGGTSTVIQTPGVTLLGYTVQQPGAAAIEQIYDLSTAVACNIMRALCGKTWRPTEVMLSRRKPNDMEPYRRFFRAPIQFDAELSAVAFPTSWLQQPVASADPLLFSHLEKAAGDLRALKQNGLAEALSAQLRSGLLRRNWAAAEMASSLGLHERTLHRKLRAAGTSYRRELENVRQSLSLQLLEGTTMSVAQVAESMGYASSSAFIRAFTRWTGLAPTEWRRAGC